MNLDDILRTVVSISPEDEPTATGLGVICGRFVLTCAHFHDHLPFGIGGVSLFDVRRIQDAEKAPLAMYLATSMDFMALAEDAIHVDLSDAGPTNGSYMLLDLGDQAPLMPSTLTFPKGQSSVRVPGFFFAPDGKTQHHVIFNVYRNCPGITYESDLMVKGCSGGPLFTEDFHLIGINTNHRTPCPELPPESLGKRIDLCCPLLLTRQMEWRELAL